MSDRKKHIDPIPDEFATYEEAAEFWDTHDTTSYPEMFRTVDVETELRHRHYEVEVDEDIFTVLSEQARKYGVSVSRLVSNMLRQQLPKSMEAL